MFIDCLDHKAGNSREKRSVSSPNGQPSPTVTPSYVQLLIRDELRRLQNQICAKDHVLCRAGPRGKQGRRGRPGNPGKYGPQGIPGPSSYGYVFYMPRFITFAEPALSLSSVKERYC